MSKDGRCSMNNVWKKAVSLTMMAAMSLPMAGCGKKGDYVHGKKGYYFQVENGISSEVTKQGSGGCWAHAATSAILSTSLIRDNKALGLTPIDVMKDVLTGHDEGWHYDLDVNMTPGCDSMVINALSDGIGNDGLVLVETLFYSYLDENEVHQNIASREQIQEIIKTKGAVTATLSFASANFYGMDHGYYTLYDDPVKKTKHHHEVCLVGWDDNFPKEYFGGYLGKELPKSDGAWLAKDSMGPDYANDGYFWISYESNLSYYCLYYMSDKYSKVLSYDGGCLDSVQVVTENVAANVFHEKGKLAAVGTFAGIKEVLGNDYVMDPNLTKLKIEVRDETMTQVLASKEVKFEYPGYYVVDLDEPLEVENYSIVVTYESQIPLESEVLESHHGIYYTSRIEEGQSFILKDGKWIDLSDASIKEILGLEYTPNNVCIKALYVD
ncbi:MAG: hypothetical protein IKG93_02680 [Clostridiales bacterium]|nr:hypothetical protein [Clostridiales bacterium]